MLRRTRIVATLGPATDAPGVLEALLDVGLDVVRINFSHGTADDHRRRIGRLRELAEARKLPVAVLGDLPGPKLRVLLDAPLVLTPGTDLAVGLKPGVPADLTLTEPEAVARVRVGHRVLLDDGRLQARVHQAQTDKLVLRIEIGGTLLPNKGLNLPDSEIAIPAVTRRDREAIALAAEVGVDWLALSFVRDPGAAHELRGVMRGHGLELPILAKIERPEAVRKAADIIQAFDGVMVARGDLGVEIPLEKVPHVQKKLISMARAASKPVVTATDMLDSMRHNSRPTRAEASDVANAVYDGTDAVMLSGETAVGEFPIDSIRCMDRILREAESNQADDGPRLVPVEDDFMHHITHLTCALAHKIQAQAIIAPSISGRTARFVARHRPRPRIVAVSQDAAVVRQLSLVWGVKAVHQDLSLHSGDDRLAAALQAAFGHQAVQAGDLVVMLAGHPIEGGEGLPTIRTVRVGPDGRSCEP